SKRQPRKKPHDRRKPSAKPLKKRRNAKLKSLRPKRKKQNSKQNKIKKLSKRKPSDRRRSKKRPQSKKTSVNWKSKRLLKTRLRKKPNAASERLKNPPSQNEFPLHQQMKCRPNPLNQMRGSRSRHHLMQPTSPRTLLRLAKSNPLGNSSLETRYNPNRNQNPMPLRRPLKPMKMWFCRSIMVRQFSIAIRMRKIWALSSQTLRAAKSM